MSPQQQEAEDYERNFSRADLFEGFDRGDLGRDYEEDQIALWEAEERQ
jgi:hypothetical protein